MSARETADGRVPQRILLLAAHPNDEFSLVVTLRNHVQAGDEVWAAWFAHDDREKVLAMRRAEAERAMDWIGVSPDHILYAGLPALPLAEQLVELAHEMRALVGRVRPDLVYCPAFEGGHPDHDALSFVTYEVAVRGGVEAREYPIYRRAEKRRVLKSVPAFGRMLPGLTEPDEYRLSLSEASFKRRVWKGYSSQRMLEWLVRLSGDEKRFFRTETTRPVPVRDYSRPPHDRPLLYEQSLDAVFSFDEFARAVRRFHWSGGVGGAEEM